jgi:hypothetical protein
MIRVLGWLALLGRSQAVAARTAAGSCPTGRPDSAGEDHKIIPAVFDLAAFHDPDHQIRAVAKRPNLHAPAA